MKRSIWIPALVIVLLAAGGLYAFQAKRSGRPISITSFLQPRLTVPEGTALAMRLQTPLSTKSTNVGDHFRATVTTPVHVDGEVAIPAGAEVVGHVIVAEQPGKASGRGSLQLAYDDLRFDGGSYALGTRSRVYLSPSGTDKDVKMIGGGAVAGGVVGGILGGGSGAVKGAVVGGAAGTGAALLTRGPQLVMASGTPLRTHLARELKVPRAKQTA